MSIDSRELRDAFGQFATGVCVVTATAEDGRTFGMTINSFSSVSLSPALLMWSIQNNSAQTADWLSVEYFGVNVLAADQQEISNYFASKGERSVPEAFHAVGEQGVPMINQAKAQFVCRVKEHLPGGDHTIIIGEILAANTPRSAAAPLMFYAGKYRQLAD
jgi:flavin reductase (DIM6/NTAB) family NADH-FMN oxidoreductase RutF